MTRERQYACSYCERPKPRSNLLVKRLQYAEMGTNGKVRQSRVLAWVCSDCLSRDHDYHRPAMTTAPGFKGTKIWHLNDGTDLSPEKNSSTTAESQAS